MKVVEAVDLMHQLGATQCEVGASGNASFWLAENRIAIKPSGLSYEQVSLDNISIVDFDGALIQGLKPSSDLHSHLYVYRHKSTVRCIVHTHAHYTTVLALLGKSINVHSTMHADYFGDKIKCLPFINHRTANFGQQILEASINIALMEKHGAIMLLDNPQEGPKLLKALEEVSKLTYEASLLAASEGFGLAEIIREEIEHIRKYYKDDYGQR